MGLCFLRLKARKGANAAVVAAARKLTTIIWHMLTEGQPYRYAPERTTREKLGSVLPLDRRMHYHATGLRRKGGVARGTRRPAGYGSGPRSRDTRAKEDKASRAAAQADYERLLEERAKSPRSPRAT